MITLEQFWLMPLLKQVQFVCALNNELIPETVEEAETLIYSSADSPDEFFETAFLAAELNGVKTPSPENEYIN